MIEEKKLLQLYIERNEQAIKETDAMYGKYCRKIAYNILYNREDTEECINDTYLNAWNAIPPTIPDKISIYLGKITRNLAFNRFKQKHRVKRGGGEMTLILDELEECIHAGKSIEDEIENKEITKAINIFLASLSVEYRVIFLRRYWFSDSLTDMSKRFGVSEGALKSLLFRLRKKLKTVLEGEDILL